MENICQRLLTDWYDVSEVVYVIKEFIVQAKEYLSGSRGFWATLSETQQGLSEKVRSLDGDFLCSAMEDAIYFGD
ncbi:MAG: hypothetical protein ACLR2E_24790 [Lachnospiraceae bacterium]